MSDDLFERPADGTGWAAAARQLRESLESAARLKKTLTYTDAARSVRAIQLDAVSPRLAELLCEQIHHDATHGLPLLSSIVIGHRRNQPGRGFFRFARQYFRFDDDERFWIAEVEAVYAHYGRRSRARTSDNNMSHRVALAKPKPQRPEDQADFIMSFFD